jgi:hypothetical protein
MLTKVFVITKRFLFRKHCFSFMRMSMKNDLDAVNLLHVTIILDIFNQFSLKFYNKFYNLKISNIGTDVL